MLLATRLHLRLELISLLCKEYTVTLSDPELNELVSSKLGLQHITQHYQVLLQDWNVNSRQGKYGYETPGSTLICVD